MFFRSQGWPLCTGLTVHSTSEQPPPAYNSHNCRFLWWPAAQRFDCTVQPLCSQTFVQRPPLGQEKCGHYAEGCLNKISGRWALGWPLWLKNGHWRQLTGIGRWSLGQVWLYLHFEKLIFHYLICRNRMYQKRSFFFSFASQLNEKVAKEVVNSR